jgi:hypothetical protein
MVSEVTEIHLNSRRDFELDVACLFGTLIPGDAPDEFSWHGCDCIAHRHVDFEGTVLGFRG